MVTQTHKQELEEQGYFVVEGLLSPQEVAESVAEVEKLHEVARTVCESDKHNFQIEPFVDDAQHNGKLVLRKIEQPYKYSPWFDALARQPKLVAILSELLGPDLLLFRSTLMLKPAFRGSVHGFHQDTSYWPMHPPHLVTVSIAMTDATPQNGCFQVIPDSHKTGTRDISEWGDIARDQDSKLTDRQDIDMSQVIYVPLKAGSALFFHSALVHGSGPNKSPNPRNTALYAYFTPDVKYAPTPDQPREAIYNVVAGMDGQKQVTFTAEETGV